MDRILIVYPAFAVVLLTIISMIKMRLVLEKHLKSGITSAPEYEEFSFRSLVHGKPNIDLELPQ